MCNLTTEGTKYGGCGHYIITVKTGKIDCNNPYCVHSQRHRTPCHNCACEKFYGPDASETVTSFSRDYCPECRPWYKGATTAGGVRG
ncbi:hypothetical protein SCP_0308080 [Sparassis crispa]|uniref:Uncharacterized protein n=1 Tax=Sparassis crispa TaxID=139825 RepID=A0A401GG55_9APHY|nr:hypothetical protein SCP_0308080 [Sparassis crispa]GBE81083.1 hypothetical protein SCP_0308080 [Sparassis crispa]